MEPTLQPPFTFPSRHDMANLANGLKATLNQDYVHSVPKNSADINIETALNRADIIVPMGQQQSLDPKGVLPMPTNIYVQPGLAEGMTNLSQRENAETTIMKTLSANNALKRGNYQAAEHVMGRGTTTEEIQNQTTVPNKRASQMGGPDVHVGPRSQHIGVPVRNGPNYQSMAHVVSHLGEYIDVAAKQLNIPEDQVIRLKTRYNLFTPASSDARPNVPAGWQSIWELVKRDLEGMRTGTNDIMSNVPGTDNGLRQAGGQRPPPSMPVSQPAPSFTVPAGTVIKDTKPDPVQVHYGVADHVQHALHRAKGIMSSVLSNMTGGKITRSGNSRNQEEYKQSVQNQGKWKQQLLAAIEQVEKFQSEKRWTPSMLEHARTTIEHNRRWLVDHRNVLSEQEVEDVQGMIDIFTSLANKREATMNPMEESSAEEIHAPTNQLESVYPNLPPLSEPTRPVYPKVESSVEPKWELPNISLPNFATYAKRGEQVVDESWAEQIKYLLEQIRKNPEGLNYETLTYLQQLKAELENDRKAYKSGMSKKVFTRTGNIVRVLKSFIYKLTQDLGSGPMQSPNIEIEDEKYNAQDYDQDLMQSPNIEIEDEKYNAQDYDQDLNFSRAPGNTTSDFMANNQVLAKENAAGEEQPSEQLQQEPIPSENVIAPGDNPIIQEYVIDQVPLTHRSDDNRREQAAIYQPADQQIAVGQRHATFFGGLLNRNPFMPATESEKLNLPRNWSIQTQLQNPPSYTEKEMTDPQKAKYVFTHPTNRISSQENNTMDTYSTKRYIAAPLSEQLMTRTGRNAVPISAQIQTSQSNQHALWEVNTRQLAQDPSRAGEQLRNEFMPQHPPQEMYEKNIGSDKPIYGTYDNTIPQGTGRLQKATFGKHVVDLPKLFKQGIVSLSHVNGRKVSRVRNEYVAVGSGLHAALCNIASGKRPSKKMSPQEKVHLSRICDRSQIDHGQYKAGAINMNPLEELHIAMGEVNAGNNAVALKQQIRKLLSVLGQSGKLSQEQISSIRTHYLA